MLNFVKYHLYRPIKKKIKNYKINKYSLKNFGNYSLLLNVEHYTQFMMFHYPYEPEISNFIKKKIKKNDFVIEVGCHIGFFTCLIASIINKGHLLGFEPNTDNYNLLKNNININNFKNVSLMKVALSNKNKQTKLHLNKFNEGGHSISENINHKKFSNYELIKSKKLDDYINIINKEIKLIKIDAEGHEDQILIGMEKLLKNKKIAPKYIIIETENLQKLRRIFSYLVKYDYLIYSNINDKCYDNIETYRSFYSKKEDYRETIFLKN